MLEVVVLELVRRLDVWKNISKMFWLGSELRKDGLEGDMLVPLPTDYTLKNDTYLEKTIFICDFVGFENNESNSILLLLKNERKYD